MKTPLFGDTITLYKKQDESYTRHVIEGVQWRQKAERYSFQRGTTSVFDMKTVTSVTIPAGNMQNVSVYPSEGDVLILDIGPELTSLYTIADLKRDHASYCTVRAVADNTLRPKLKHWKVAAV